MLEFLPYLAIYTIPILLILTAVVTIHELGHFWMAKACDVAIDQFAIGFGKPIVQWTDKSGVQWRIGWIPLGGYVRFAGDSNEASVPDSEDLEDLRSQIEAKLGKEAVGRFYHFKPVWQRALVAAAGPAANFVLALVIFMAIFMTLETARLRPVVGEVMPNSPAAAAGFQPGDVIKSVNGREIRDFEEFKIFVMLRSGETIHVTVDRAGEQKVLSPTLRRIAEKDGVTGAKIKRGQVGIGPDPNALYYYRARNPVEGFNEATHAIWVRLETTFTYIGRIFKGRENGDQFSGIVGMAGAAGGVTKATIKASPDLGTFFANFGLNMVAFAASISIGIGFVNLLPIPMLDGGHLVFYAYEAIARRPLAAKVQAASFKVGLALVLALMLFATWNDLVRYDAFRFIGGLIS